MVALIREYHQACIGVYGTDFQPQQFCITY